jgi:type VI protein secretion system component VasK
MKHSFLYLTLFLLFGCASPKYLEKESEALSQSVYATKDSIELARLDLADTYSTQAARIVIPPKHRIKIEPVFKNTKTQRVLVVPEKYKNDKVVVVNTTEYQELLKDAETAEQLQTDNKNLKDHISLVDIQLQEQQKVTSELILKNQKLTEDILKKEKVIAEKNSSILKLWGVLIAVLVLIGVYFYIKIRGIIPLPF